MITSGIGEYERKFGGTELDARLDKIMEEKLAAGFSETDILVEAMKNF